MATQERNNMCLSTGCNHQNCTEDVCNLSDVSKNNLENLIPNIPDDVVIIEEILPRLPAKSLWRFRCVSKIWNFSISQLINSRKTSILNTTHIVLGCYRGSDDLRFCSFRNLYDEPHVCTFIKESSISSYYNVVGSCDGLICIGITPMDLVLWNPCTEECNNLPKIPDYNDVKMVGVPYSYYYFFGKVDDDYKIVCFAIADSDLYDENIVSIYSMKVNQWKHIDSYPVCLNNGKRSRPHRSKFANGKVYWDSCLSNFEDDKVWEIGYLDVVTEKYGIIAAPTNANLAYDELELGVSEGCLYLLFGDKHFGDVWSLNAADESWTKVFTFAYNGSFEDYGLRAFYVLEISAEIILIYNHKILIFNITDSSLKCNTLKSTMYYIDVSTYVPSFISPFRSTIREQE